MFERKVLIRKAQRENIKFEQYETLKMFNDMLQRPCVLLMQVGIN